MPRAAGVVPYMVRSIAEEAPRSLSTLSRCAVPRLSVSRSPTSVAAAFRPQPAGSRSPPLRRPTSATSRARGGDVLAASTFNVSAPTTTDHTARTLTFSCFSDLGIRRLKRCDFYPKTQIRVPESKSFKPFCVKIG